MSRSSLPLRLNISRAVAGKRQFKGRTLEVDAILGLPPYTTAGYRAGITRNKRAENSTGR